MNNHQFQWEYVGKESPIQCWWKCQLTQLCGKSIWSLLNKTSIELPDDNRNFTSWNMHQVHNQEKTSALLVHCSTSNSRQKSVNLGHRCPKTGHWIKKLWYIYTVKYYLTTRKDKVMQFAAMWMDMESTMVSEVIKREADSGWSLSYVEYKLHKGITKPKRQ